MVGLPHRPGGPSAYGAVDGGAQEVGTGTPVTTVDAAQHAAGRHEVTLRETVGHREGEQAARVRC